MNKHKLKFIADVNMQDDNSPSRIKVLEESAPFPSDKIVRRSNSVVIQCNTSYQTFPDVQGSFGESNKSQDLTTCDIHDNLEDIKYEIEKLMIERESLIRENLLLGFYKECTDPENCLVKSLHFLLKL